MTALTHLRITKTPLKNPRRTRPYHPQPVQRDSLRAHGQGLIQDLQQYQQDKPDQTGSDHFILKLAYTGNLDLQNLEKHGITFLSQEDQQLCIAFADEQGLATFSSHLAELGLTDKKLTYQQILIAIDGIGHWTEQDRTSWVIRKEGLPQEEQFILDIELWPVFVINSPERERQCQDFEAWLKEQNIQQHDKLNRDSLIMYRVDVNHTQAHKLLQHTDVRLVDLPPDCGIQYAQLNCDLETLPAPIQQPADDAATICLLDSGITTNHPLLGPAIGESANFTDTEDVFDTTGHGTAVAGIALYGDLEACQANNVWQPEIRLLSGKILDQKDEFDPETIENKIIKAVTYFVEEYRCKIFNLSIGNAHAPYDHRHVRGIAYVLDDLARQFDILFVVSSGNFTGSDEPPVPEHSWRDEYPDYLLSDQSLIIDPAPALNVITVGSLARHNATSDAQRYPQEINQLCPAAHHQPSPFTRHGPSVKGSIKPDLVAVGGNLAVPMRQEGKQYQSVGRGLGVLSCNAQFLDGPLFKEISGTSFAAPYISHLAARLLNTYPEASANLLRALLVNHAHMPDEITQAFPEAIRESYKKDRKILPEHSVAGYGLIDESALFRSSENVVVLMAEEGIEDDTHQFFELPLPAEFLRKKRATREINITLAYCPAVRTTRLEYRATKINFCLVKDRSLDNLQRAFNHETQKETKTRNDDRTTNRKISATLRDKGTVQSSTWKMKQLDPDDIWFVVVTRQDRPWGKSLSENIESYALVITVADRENNEAQLYTQISQRIQQQVAARARV